MANRKQREFQRNAERIVRQQMDAHKAEGRLEEMDDMTARMLGKNPITPSGVGHNPNSAFGRGQGGSGRTARNPVRGGFISSLTQLFGFNRTSNHGQVGTNNIEFVKVDSQSDMRISQGKMGKTFSTKMVGKLEELFDAWLRDTTDTYRILEDRNKRIAEIEFAVMNDPYLSTAAEMYADEATQIDVQGKLITIECADIRMKEKMEDLLEQWGVTQNRIRSVAYNLATYGDAFWSNKVTENGVVRINPIGIHQVKERLEFDAKQVQTDISLRKGYITAINRSAKLQALFDTMDNVEHEEFADLFDTRLFGFAIDDDMVVPPWAITHFRLNVDQSEFFPMGKSFFLKALAPFRQCNATMVLQSLARVMSFPVTVYTVKTAPGMDESLQFEKINEVREAYDLIGESGAGNEAFSVNTKIWAPEGLLTLEMHSPDIDIKAIEDIEMYQKRVAVASGVPRGFIDPEGFGVFGNSAISLIEQFKPFARKVFTVQSAILDGLTNLFRLHFAITGEFDYRESFVLSLKFPNEEVSDARQASKQNSLNLSKDVLETIASIVGAIDDPLPSEVIQDILTKFSFLDPEDIKKWVKENPNQQEAPSGDAMDGEGGDLSGGLGGGGMGGGMGDLGGGMDDLGGADFGGDMDLGGGGEAEDGMMPGPEEGGMPLANDEEKQEAYRRVEQEVLREQKAGAPKLKFEERQRRLRSRYTEMKDTLYEKVIKNFSRVDEATINNRHYKYARVEECNIPMYQLFQKKGNVSPSAMVLTETRDVLNQMRENDSERNRTWEEIKARIQEAKVEEPSQDKDEPVYTDEQREEDEKRAQAINSIIS